MIASVTVLANESDDEPLSEPAGVVLLVVSVLVPLCALSPVAVASAPALASAELPNPLSKPNCCSVRPVVSTGAWRAAAPTASARHSRSLRVIDMVAERL